ncbi:hypothetical protein [Nocardia alni]|uniref:hypothetical protein n=1 Tax=Nocardia alni TaxID=2815723 RepID=UPI001C221C76|nr:hypothetical protein [Nocardia alni]
MIGVATACASRVPSATGVTASFTIPAENRGAEFPSTPPSASGTLPLDLAGLNRSDASAVAAAVVRIWFTTDTRIDSSPHAARLRACPLLAAPYCLAIRDFPPKTGPGADWLSLTAQQAAITVGANDIRPADESGPPDSATRADRLLEVTEHLVTPKGPLPDRRTVVALSLIRDGVQWQVTEVSVR